MYTIQYWNERDAEWRGCGRVVPDLDTARRHMRGLRDQCGGCVRFRAIETLPSNDGFLSLVFIDNSHHVYTWYVPHLVTSDIW